MLFDFSERWELMDKARLMWLLFRLDFRRKTLFYFYETLSRFSEMQSTSGDLAVYLMLW